MPLLTHPKIIYLFIFFKTTGGLRPEIRLRYLAQVLEYEVEFSDFPKVITFKKLIYLTVGINVILLGQERRFR